MTRTISDAIGSSKQSLVKFWREAIPKGLEVRRSSQSQYAILLTDSEPSNDVWRDNLGYMLENQKSDGGWADPEETAWVTGVLMQILGQENEIVKRAVSWLISVRDPGGGWGRHPRDQVRIPTTALAITLVPSVATYSDRAWVRQTWEKDMASPVQLSYKGGFYLLTVQNEEGGKIDPLVEQTIVYLTQDQNDDGGFGPWRDHPIGSDPWSTGVVLWGLSKWIDRVDPVVIEKGLAWLERTQLPSGYWPYHYLDEGTSYALIGAVSAMRAMESRK